MLLNGYVAKLASFGQADARRQSTGPIASQRVLESATARFSKALSAQQYLPPPTRAYLDPYPQHLAKGQQFRGVVDRIFEIDT
jgi:hypothetical protein